MTFGQKLKKLRNELNITQKDLAEKLNVTFQTVSKWESGINEPDLNTLKELSKIFNVSIDSLLSDKDEVEKLTESVVEKKEDDVKPQVEVKPSVPLVVCADCNKLIYDKEDIVNREYQVYEGTGRSSYLKKKTKTICKDCENKILQEEKKQAELRKARIDREVLKRRVHSFIWPTIFLIALIVVSIIIMKNGEINNGLIALGIGITGFTFLGTMILNNTFIGEMWLAIASWGFVKMPGVIFEFSIDGFIFLIVIKIVLAILGFLIAFGAIVLATGLCMILSVVVYPFAVIRNFKGIVDD